MTAVLDASFTLRRGEFELELSIDVEPGRTLALLGPNGAGKSTAAAALAGLIPIDSGHVRLGDVVLDDPERGVFVPPEHRRVGVVFQDYLLFPHLTVAENIAFGLKARHLSAEEVVVKTKQWLDRVGLESLGSRKARDLSGGQAQRVAVARALITEPDVLILDEPLSALDASKRVELRHQLTDHLAAFIGPRLLITHEATEAFLLADEIAVVEHGRLTQSGSADDIRLRPRTRYVADLAGANFLTGEARDGVIEIEGHQLRIADKDVRGPVLATIHPRAVVVHLHEPEGSARNAWQTDVARTEHFGDRVRIRTTGPLPLTAEVTSESHDALGLTPGSRIWISVKATEVGVDQV